MDAITYLRQLGRMDKRIGALMERRDHYRQMATHGTSRYNAVRMGGTDRRSKVEDCVCQLVDLEREIDQRACEYADTTREVESTIARVADDRYRDILTWRYVNGWSWERVADAMHYDRTWVWRMHGRALLAIDQIRSTKQREDVL